MGDIAHTFCGCAQADTINRNACADRIAGPKGGTKQKPVGLVFIGIKKGNKTLYKKYLFKNKKLILI